MILFLFIIILILILAIHGGRTNEPLEKIIIDEVRKVDVVGKWQVRGRLYQPPKSNTQISILMRGKPRHLGRLVELLRGKFTCSAEHVFAALKLRSDSEIYKFLNSAKNINSLPIGKKNNHPLPNGKKNNPPPNNPPSINPPPNGKNNNPPPNHPPINPPPNGKKNNNPPPINPPINPPPNNPPNGKKNASGMNPGSYSQLRGFCQAEELYRFCRRYEVKFGEKFLDVGCGNGEITAEFAKIIKSKAYCVEANSNHQHPDIVYSFGKLPYSDATFDVITALLSLHHVEALEELLHEMWRVLKPGGSLVIKEHDCWDVYDALLVDIEHVYYILFHDNGKLSDYFIRHKNIHGWIAILEKAGFKFAASDFSAGEMEVISPTRIFYLKVIKQNSGRNRSKI